MSDNINKINNNNNIFDLNSNLNKLLPQITNNKKKPNGKSYTKIEINTMLQNFIIVPKEQWINLSINTFIRYKRNDGSFRRGGFIINNYYDTKTQERKIKLICNTYVPGNIDNNPMWIIKYNDIEIIWKKIKNLNNIELKTIDTKINLLEKKIENIETDILNIKSNIQNIIQWLKQKK